MGIISGFIPEKLIIGILTSRPDALAKVADDLVLDFGSIEYTSAILPFSFTSYYDREMGSPIYRRFVAFEKLVDPVILSSAKLRTNVIEADYALGGNRTVNIDPGLLSLKRLILASTKDNGRRVPLQNGIYAEITLVYMDGDFHTLDWTYPDYKSNEYRDIFREIRNLYRLQLKQHRKKGGF